MKRPSVMRIISVIKRENSRLAKQSPAGLISEAGSTSKYSPKNNRRVQTGFFVNMIRDVNHVTDRNKDGSFSFDSLVYVKSAWRVISLIRSRGLVSYVLSKKLTVTSSTFLLVQKKVFAMDWGLWYFIQCLLHIRQFTSFIQLGRWCPKPVFFLSFGTNSISFGAPLEVYWRMGLVTLTPQAAVAYQWLRRLRSKLPLPRLPRASCSVSASDWGFHK